MAILIILVFFIICVSVGSFLGKKTGSALFPDRDSRPMIIDRSVTHHHHYHHHQHEHKTITIIDEDTREKILEMKQ